MKPLLAVNTDEGTIIELLQKEGFLYGSDKLDGVRCLISKDKVLARSLKPIPNMFIKKMLKAAANTCLLKGEWLDGEIVVRGKTFNQIQSMVMSEDGSPDFELHVFDYLDENNTSMSFSERYEIYNEFVRLINSDYVKSIHQFKLVDYAGVEELEMKFLDAGSEGMMLRKPSGEYKYGRSTLKQGILLKVKRFETNEAKVIGYNELMHNDNVTFENELGQSVRSSCKENLSGGNTLGSLNVVGINGKWEGVTFSVGTGFDATTRKDIWDKRNENLGKIISYSWQACGSKDKPRIPVFLGFRNNIDIS